MNYSQYFLVFIYILSVFLYLITKNVDRNTITSRSILIMILVFILVVTRTDKMVDYKPYVEDLSSPYYSLGVEPSFSVIKFLSQKVFHTYYAAFGIYASLSLGLRFNYIEKYPSLVLGCLLVYISNILVVQDMIAIRSAVASAMLLYIVNAKEEQKMIKCLMLIIVAILFHYSAILFFIVFILNNKKDRRFFYLSLIIVSYALALSGLTFGALLGKVIGTDLSMFHFSNYSEQKLNIFNLLQIGHILLCVYAWYNIKKIKKHYSRGLLFLKLYTIAVCLLPVFSDLISVGIRMSELFLSVEIILVPMIFTSTIKTKSLQKISLIGYTTIIFYFTLTNIQYWNIENYY